MYVEFDRDALISLDTKTQAEIDDLHIKNGTITTDEARERINLPHSGTGVQLVPENMSSADYKAKNETLKLEAAALDVEVKKADLALKLAQAEAVKTPPKPFTLSPTPAASPTTPDIAASLKTLQAETLASMVGKWEDAQAVAEMIRSLAGKIATLHGVGDHLASFAAKYQDATAKRLAGGQPNATAETNRAINALNHHAITLARGVNAKVTWKGGVFDGQTRSIAEPWQGSLRHPPINDVEHECFLIPA
jgi:hypothetical protein